MTLNLDVILRNEVAKDLINKLQRMKFMRSFTSLRVTQAICAYSTILILFAGVSIAGAGAIEELENAFSEVAQKAGPSVVSISTVQNLRVQAGYYTEPQGTDKALNEFIRRFFAFPPETELRKFGLGSGIIIRPDGYILTNYHVVQGASGIEVTLDDGRKFPATVLGNDVRSDFVVLKIDAGNLPVAALGDSSRVRTGQWVVALGNPFGYLLKDPKPSLTVGVVSATHRELADLGMGQGPFYFDLIQTDAAINPGNSGGPLVNLRGEVIGINMAIFSTSGAYAGIGFAVPINVAKGIMDDLIRGERVTYGWLGVGVGPVDSRIAKELKLPDEQGAVVLKIFEGSAAEKFKLREMDVIRSIGNVEVRSPEDLIKEIARLRAGAGVSVEIYRRGELLRLEMTLGPHPLEESKGRP